MSFLQRLLGTGRYRGADTLAEKKRRMLSGAWDGIWASIGALVFLFLVSSFVDRPSKSTERLVMLVLIVLPLIVGVALEIRSGRAYGRETEDESDS